MRWPGILAVRMALASFAAVVGVVVLQRVVEARERSAATRVVARVPPTPSALPALGFRLRPSGGVVLLASRLEAVPPEVAPVLQLLADGSLAVRRPPPLATSPGRTAYAGVAIVVPRSAMATWSPAARGTLAELLATLIDARPLPRERVRVVDAPFGERELQTLLAWLP